MALLDSHWINRSAEPLFILDNSGQITQFNDSAKSYIRDIPPNGSFSIARILCSKSTEKLLQLFAKTDTTSEQKHSLFHYLNNLRSACLQSQFDGILCKRPPESEWIFCLKPLKKQQQQLQLALTEKDWQIQQIIDAIPHMIYVKDSDCRLVLANKYTADFYNTTPEELRGCVQHELHRQYSKSEAQKILELDQQIINRETTSIKQNEWLSCGNGESKLFKTLRVPFQMKQSLGELVVAINITQYQIARQQLETSNQRLGAITSTIPDLGIIFDEDGFFLEVFGANIDNQYERTQRHLGKTLSDVLPENTSQEILATLRKTVATQQSQVLEYQLERDNGNTWYEGRSAILPQQPGERPSLIWLSRNINERKATEARAEFLAYHDPLTGLPNRALLIDRLEQALSRARRDGQMGAVMFIDLDHFKHINDSLGHAVGDRLLEQIAIRIRDGIRGVDTVGRLGGDEFVVIISDIGSNLDLAQRNTHALAEKLRQSLSEPIHHEHHELIVAASIGVVIFPSQYRDAEEMLSHADTAMYNAKARGRNNLVFFEPDMATTVKRRLAFENDLRKAMDAHQLTLHYQPKVSTDSNAIVGAESLLRWNHPQWGLVPPVSFIPILEATGLIIPVGEWVIENACLQLRHWQEQQLWPAERRLSINISPRQFLQADFFSRLMFIVAATGVQPENIDLEITEGTVISNLDDTITKMQQIQQSGFSFSIDDFGTGYSSLSYLKRLPLDTLKIDQAFIRDVTEDSDDAAIVETIVNIAKRFHLNVVAEGVETEQQVAFLKAQHCDHYQGFFCSKPLPGNEFGELLRSH